MKTGFIGLGAMGTHMARHLAKAGLLETAFNRTLTKSELFRKEFACLVSISPSELAKQCELIIISVSRDTDVLEIVNEMKMLMKSSGKFNLVLMFKISTENDMISEL